MIQITNSGWHGGTANVALKARCRAHNHERTRASHFLHLAYHAARLEHEMQQMWEQELMEE